MTSHLLAIKLTARFMAVAVYFGRELHYVEVKELASSIAAATDSLEEFFGALSSHFHIDSTVAQECDANTRANSLLDHLTETVRTRALPFWSLPQSALLSVFAETPLSKLSTLRDIVSNYWPHLIDPHENKMALDAAALGLYFQTERLLTALCKEAV